MTVQDNMIAALRSYMDNLTAPVDGYPVIDLDVGYSSRSPIHVQLYTSVDVRDEADNSPNGGLGYVLADRNVDDGSSTMGFIAITKSDNEEYEKPYQAVPNAFPSSSYEVNGRGGGEICDAAGWRADYLFVTYTGS